MQRYLLQDTGVLPIRLCGFRCSVHFIKTTPPPNLTKKLLLTTWGIFEEGGNLIKYIIKCNMIFYIVNVLKPQGFSYIFFPEIKYLYNPCPHSIFSLISFMSNNKCFQQEAIQKQCIKCSLSRVFFLFCITFSFLFSTCQISLSSFCSRLLCRYSILMALVFKNEKF